MAAGELFVAANDLTRAAKIVSRLSSRIEPEPQIYANLLTGSLALRKNQTKEAIDAFQKAQKISNSWLAHFYLGKAYLQTNSFTEADDEFELCLKRQGEVSAVFLDDLPTFRLLPQVYYYLGRAQEGLKSPAASESYRTFLKFQPEANNEMVSDAKRRLEAR
jgi:tetratricopeptide (TPR) repeat protein